MLSGQGFEESVMGLIAKQRQIQRPFALPDRPDWLSGSDYLQRQS